MLHPVPYLVTVSPCVALLPRVGDGPCLSSWSPSLPCIPCAGDSEVQGMMEAVKSTVVGLGVCCRRYDTMFYWLQTCPDSTKYLVQVTPADY